MSVVYSNPMWEDQIVPTLRKRLERESLYLSHRLSPGSRPRSFLEASSPSNPVTVPFRATPTFGPVGSSLTCPEYTEGSSRKRTLSTVMARDIHQKSSRGLPLFDTSLPQSNQQESIRSDRQARRQRSNTQLASKSATFQSHIPVPKRLGSSPPKSTAGSPGGGCSLGPGSPPKPHLSVLALRVDEPNDSRESIELEGRWRTVEGLVQNELPPFRVYPDEAMRIAERGHVLGDCAEEEEQGRVGQTEGSGSRLAEFGVGTGEVRKRSLTMRGEGGMAEKRGTKPRTRGNGRSAPSSVSKAGALGTASARHSPLKSSTNSNSEKSRLGLAAHLIPPETYTPPKGANWDDVVLPAVAKKLGIGVKETKEHGDSGDLAVEWDKDGTPVKWIKRSHLSPSASPGGETGLGASTTASSPSSFNPSFEPSWDHPLTPSLRTKPSLDALEMGVLRSLRDKTADLPSESAAPASNSSNGAPVTMETPPRTGSMPRAPGFGSRTLSGQASSGSLRSAAAAQLRAASGGQSVFGTCRGQHSRGQGGGPLTALAPTPWATTPPNASPIGRGGWQTGGGHGAALGSDGEKDRRKSQGRGKGRGHGQGRGNGNGTDEEHVGSGCGCIVM